MGLLRDLGHPVEVWGWDEAYVGLKTGDVPDNPVDPIEVAEQIRTVVSADTGLSCSVGISDNKQRAKVATGFAKPAGIFALTDDLDRAYFGRDRNSRDQIGMIDDTTRAIFGRSYAAEPDVLVKQLQEDEAIQAADTLLLTIPNQLGVSYNAELLRNIATHVAPAIGWAPAAVDAASAS